MFVIISPNDLSHFLGTELSSSLHLKTDMFDKLVVLGELSENANNSLKLLVSRVKKLHLNDPGSIWNLKIQGN